VKEGIAVKCEVCGHSVKRHNREARCSVCKKKCYSVVAVELPAHFYEALEHIAKEFKVSIMELTNIVLEVEYYCDRVLALPATKIDAVIGEAVKKGDMLAVEAVMREVTEEEKGKITQLFTLLLEKDEFFEKIMKTHRIPAPNYIALFHHILIVKASFLPGLVEALERRVRSLEGAQGNL